MRKTERSCHGGREERKERFQKECPLLTAFKKNPGSVRTLGRPTGQRAASRLTPEPEVKNQWNIPQIAGRALSSSRKTPVPQKTLPVLCAKGRGEERLCFRGYQGGNQCPMLTHFQIS